MDIETNRNWMGPRLPVNTIARDVIRILLSAVAAGIGVSVFLALTIVTLAMVSPSAHAADAGTMRPDEATSGSFLVKVQPSGQYVQSPTLHTDVAIQVSGIVARATVSQVFRNDSDQWVEGIYVFPLPEKAAVDHLRMRVGERVIEGQIREREQARAEYQAAKRAGKRASLLEQERPNIFTSSVANLGPGETLTVEIEFQQTLDYRQGEVSLRFPLVVAPRYIPGGPAESGDSGSGWSADTDQVADASRVTPPVIDQGEVPRNPVSLSISVDAGFPLADVFSRYHTVVLAQSDESRFTTTLAEGSVPANRDFELVWKAQPDTMPRSAVFSETRGGEHYVLLTLFPPSGEMATHKRMPREVIYVIDTSGSMHGASMEQAKRAVELAIGRLSREDRFNVIQFNSVTDVLFNTAVPATQDNVSRARRYVSALEANGGTEMASALQAALPDERDEGYVRQVIFLTDGSVGNEDALFRLINDRLGVSRLFTIGIGSAPNSHFMTKAAQLGRGTFTYIGDVTEVAEKMSQLFARLENPVLSNIEVSWPRELNAEQSQQRIPDLYLGEPIVLSARVDGEPRGEVGLSGRTVLASGGEQRWRRTLVLQGARPAAGIGVIWARSKVEQLTDTLHDGASEVDVRQAVIDLALRHSLVTKYTSLVAIDVTPVRPADSVLNSQQVPLNLPLGWDQNKVFGALPQTATPAMLHALLSLLTALAAFSFRPRRWS